MPHRNKSIEEGGEWQGWSTGQREAKGNEQVEEQNEIESFYKGNRHIFSCHFCCWILVEKPMAVLGICRWLYLFGYSG